MNDFEQHLKNQRPRGIPGSWRGEILAAAHAASAAESPQAGRLSSPIRDLASLMRGLLWPHPRAWAGLAALWIVIGFLNGSAAGGDEIATASVPAEPVVISPGQLASLTEQRRLQRELLGLTADRAKRPAARPEPDPEPKPRSALAPSWGSA